ncbi:Uu.00g032510.m01.CDS01 [Anthostomella pinea]|uniref:Uu.00g032510.m01.CDS01 n=1 Tax=Anthostomella pinea TaxID=933095 RepID=A0AAI8V8R2_9PEZI|nr:Uu.00g032510.m01.CDS01 [Anthostomella pinea]
MHDYIKRVQAVIWNRVVLEGAAGHDVHEDALVGIGPPLTEKDDLVCILFGCSVPCILRPLVSVDLEPNQGKKSRKPYAGEKLDYYEFVGEAFVYGKMDGQAMESISADELTDKTQDFRLM